MKKEVENKNSFITDLSSSESSSDESEKEIPIENKEEIKKEIEKYLLTDKKPKKTTPNKTKKLKERESSSSNSDDQRKIQTNQSNQKTKEIHPQRFTQENTCKRRRFQRTSKKGKKNLAQHHLIIAKEKTTNTWLNTTAKRFILVQEILKITLFTKILIDETSISQKR